MPVYSDKTAHKMMVKLTQGWTTRCSRANCSWNCDLGTISPAFYMQLFHMKVFYAAFMPLQFLFVIFLQREIGAKSVCKCWLNWPLTGGWWRGHLRLFMHRDERTEEVGTSDRHSEHVGPDHDEADGSENESHLPHRTDA